MSPQRMPVHVYVKFASELERARNDAAVSVQTDYYLVAHSGAYRQAGYGYAYVCLCAWGRA